MQEIEKFGPVSVAILFAVALMLLIVGALVLTEPFPPFGAGWSLDRTVILTLAGYLLFTLGVLLAISGALFLLFTQVRGKYVDLGKLGAFAVSLLVTIGMTLLISGALYLFLTKFVENLLKDKLAIILFSGGFGGLIRNIIEDRQLSLCRVRLSRDPKLDWGSLGEILIGMAAAAAIFLVLAGTLRFEGGDGTLRLIGFTLVAGVSGRSILGQLRTVLEKRINEATEKARAAEDVADRAVRDSQLVQLFMAGEDALINQHWQKAIDYFGSMIELVPGDPLGYIAQARTWKRQALTMERESDEAQQLLKRAIDATSRAIDHSPESGSAYYNRACYRALAGQAWDEVAADLEKALQLAPELRSQASSDDDFKDASEESEVDYLAAVKRLLQLTEAG